MVARAGLWRASRVEDFAVAMTDAQPALRSDRPYSSVASLTKRLAGTIFIIRVISAGLAYLAQILLARRVGGSAYAFMCMSGPGLCCSAA